MSKLLAYESYLVDLGRSITSAREEFRTHFENNSWQIVEDDAINEYLYVVPPVTEAIGNTNGRQILRIDFTSTQIGFQGFLETQKSNNKQYSFYISFSSSSRTYSANINGYSYSSGSVSGGTNDSRVLAIYDELVAAKALPENSETLGVLDFELMQLEENYHYIIITSNNNEDFTIGSTSSTTAKEISRHLVSGTLIPETRTRRRFVNCDYASGFIYYLSIHERTLVLATKTTVNFYGPIFCSWAENDVISLQTPEDLHLMELYVGQIPESSYGEVDISTTHENGYMVYASSNPEGSRGYYYQYDNTGTSTSESGVDVITLRTPYQNVPIKMYDMFISARSDYIEDKGSCMTGYNVSTTYAGIFVNKFDLGHTKVVGQGVSTGYSGYGNEYAIHGTFPNFDLKDVYVFNKTATDESLHLVRLPSISSDLNSSITDSDTSIPLTDASEFPEAGTILINDEVITYSGKSTNTLTGAERGRYGTTPSSHNLGDVSMAANWFVKINYGALLAGFTRPE